jgi:hypothetical protein
MSDTFVNDVVINIINVALAAVVCSEGEWKEQADAPQVMVRNATHTTNKFLIDAWPFWPFLPILGHFAHSLFLLAIRSLFGQDFADNQDELPNNFQSDEDPDFDDGSEPWYGNDVDRAEYYGVDDGPPSPGPPRAQP